MAMTCDEIREQAIRMYDAMRNDPDVPIGVIGIARTLVELVDCISAQLDAHVGTYHASEA